MSTLHTTPATSLTVPCAGFQGTTLIDFPGRIASIIFVPGCNLRCPYCHNGSLFSVPETEWWPSDLLWEEIVRRQPFIDGVVITGGEPSLHPGVIPFIQALRARGLEVKLDTNGLDPTFVQMALPYISYIAIDLKTIPERYYLLGTAARPGDIRERLRKTKASLITASATVEYRITMYPGIIDGVETLIAMMDFVPPLADIYLQQFVPDHAWSEEARLVTPFEVSRLSEMMEALRRHTGRDRIYLRSYA